MRRKKLDPAILNRDSDLANNREWSMRGRLERMVDAHEPDIRDIVSAAYGHVMRDGKPEFRLFYEKATPEESLRAARDAGYPGNAEQAQRNGNLSFDRLNRAQVMQDRLTRSEMSFAQEAADELEKYFNDLAFDYLLFYLLYLDVIRDHEALALIAQSVAGEDVTQTVTEPVREPETEHVTQSVTTPKTVTEREPRERTEAEETKPEERETVEGTKPADVLKEETIPEEEEEEPEAERPKEPEEITPYDVTRATMYGELERVLGEDRAFDIASMISDMVQNGLIRADEVESAVTDALAYAESTMFDLSDVIYDDMYPLRETLFADAERWAERIAQEVRDAVIRGDGIEQALERAVGRGVMSELTDIERVMETEDTRITDELAERVAEPFTDYFYSVTADDRACDECFMISEQQRKNPVPMSEYKPYETAPPFHPNCRCRIEVIWKDDNSDETYD